MNLPILIDMDGVIADFSKKYYEYALERFPDLHERLLPIDQNVNFYLHEHLEESHPHLWEQGELIVDIPELFADLDPIQGAVEGLNLLVEVAKGVGIPVYLCTKPHLTNTGCYGGKADWVRRHYGDKMLDRLILTRDKTLVQGIILVDDNPNAAKGLLEPTWEHVLFDQPYNRQHDLRRMTSWSENQVLNLVAIAEELNELDNELRANFA